MTTTTRLLILLTAVVLICTGPGALQRAHQNKEVVASSSIGFPFKIISESKSTIGPPTWFINVSVPEQFYSTENLLDVWNYFCQKYPDHNWKIDLRIYLQKTSDTGSRAGLQYDSEEKNELVANFLRQGDGAMAGGGENEIMIYRPDLNNPKETKRVLLKGKDPFDASAYTGNREADFVNALINRDDDTFKSLLAEGINVNARNQYQETALMRAANLGSIEIVTLLLSKGAEIEARNEGGWTALIYAAAKRNNEVIRLLLAKGANINAKNRLGMSALSRAVYDNHLDTVKLLIDQGADISSEDELGDTPLILAATSNAEIVKLLLEKGADVNTRNKRSETALIRCAQQESVIALIQSGADINARDVDGNTAIMQAIRSHNGNKVRILLQHGADIKIQNKNAQTALQIAGEYPNQPEVTRMLIEAGSQK